MLLSQSSEDLSYMNVVVLQTIGKYQYVIEVNDNTYVEHVLENVFHEVLECRGELVIANSMIRYSKDL